MNYFLHNSDIQLDIAANSTEVLGSRSETFNLI